MATVELPPVPKKRAGRIATGLVGVLLVGGCTENVSHPEPSFPPSHLSTSVTASRESRSPSPSPSPSHVFPSISKEPGQVPAASSLCDTQFGAQERQLPIGTPTLPATLQRPSVFVVSPDRSVEQSFSTWSATSSLGGWNTERQPDTVGIVGLATAGTIFDTTNGKAVWGKSCLPDPDTARKEVDSRVANLCVRKEFGLTEVVVYHVGTDGKPMMQGVKKC